VTRKLASLVFGIAFFAWTPVGLADDLADEAELHFTMGAKAYQERNYERALEQFLVSNRLVSNKNVIYNIARCFEQLEKFPEAFRYYDLALTTETNPESISIINEALSRIKNKVTVLSIESEPPGATLYIQRRDLGPRGTTPRRLGLDAGSYVIMAELQGYYPTQVATEALSIGEQRTIRLSLSPILGTLKILGEPGTLVSIDRPEEDKHCVSPCEIALPPGVHLLRLSRTLHESSELSVEVRADRPSIVVPRLQRQSGSIVIKTDETNALVEIDGKSRGFTPTVVSELVGEHRIRVSKVGYKPVERVVTVVPEQQSHVEFELTVAEQVQGAARRVESVEDTPSSVSIVPKTELLAFAYPTVAEALHGLPGVYFTDDRGYVGIGMRGLGRLNSYGNRVLVTLDGVPMNDNWLGSAYVGHDLMTDLGDVESVELIRGPGSAVYGTGAFSGVVNIVTRRVAENGLEVGASTGADGLARARTRANVRLGKKTTLFTSASLGRSSGRSFYFPEFSGVTPRFSGDEPGWSRGLDGMRSATLHGQLEHGIWSAHAFWHRYGKDLPNAPFDSWFGDPRATQTDSRGFFQIKAEPRISSRVSSVSRLVVNRYTFRGTYPSPLEYDADTERYRNGLEIDEYRGHWATLEQRFGYVHSEYLHVTVGAEGSYHFDVKQTGRNAGGYFLGQGGDNQHRYGILAGYVIVDANLSSRWRLSLGARVDHYTTFGTSVNPRVGTVWKPYESGNTKISIGRAFRAPSVYELYYNDGGRTQNASPYLQPETMVSAEIEHAHRFSPTVVATGSLYVNTVRGLIDVPANRDDSQAFQFETKRNPLAVAGVEFGLRRDWRSGWMASIYYGYSQIEVLSDGKVSTLLKFEEEPSYRHVSNAPSHSATFKGVAPFLIRGLSLATRMTLEDRRWDRYENPREPAQHRTKAAVLWDLVLNATDEKRRLRCAIGVYNLFDWSYEYPVGRAVSSMTTMPSGGRSFLASVETRL
jgi:outer membrane receptor protein involved in Fe transport